MRSWVNTMTVLATRETNTMTKNTMTKAVIYFTEGAFVGFATMLAWDTLVLLLSM